MIRTVFAACLGIGVACCVLPRVGDAGDEDVVVQPLSADPDPTPAMRNALSSWIDVKYQGMTLQAAVESLSRQVGVSIVLDPMLAAKGTVHSDQNVDVELQRVRLVSALEVLGRRFDLVADVRPDFIMLADREAAKMHVRKAYPVADLVLDRSSRWLDPNAGLLQQLLIDLVDRDVWEPNGGDATMMFYPSSMSIMVNAPKQTQQRIAEALSLLRRSRDQTHRLLELRQLAPIEQLFKDLARINAALDRDPQP